MKTIAEIEAAFTKFFEESPFATVPLGSEIHIAMYGSFMGGYAKAQQDFIEKMAKSKLA